VVDASPLTGLALSLLSVTVLLLFIVTVGFSGYAIVLRIAYERRNRLWASLTERWSKPVLSAIADPTTIPAVHTVVEKRYRLYFVNFVLDYSQRVRGEELNTLRSLAEPYLGVIATRVKHRRTEVRLRSVQTLGTLGLPAYEKVVLEALDDPQESVAIVAARALARPEYSHHAASVFEKMPRFSGWEPLFLAAMLAEFGPAVLPLLRDRLRDETSPEWLRAVDAIALRLQLDPRGADIAVAALESATDVDLIAALMRLIAELGRPEHLPALRRFATCASSVVRSEAMRALGAIGDAGEVPLLERGLGDPDPWASANAARGLLSVGGIRLLERLSTAHPEHAVLLGHVAREADA
jgi:HEAT repeat protein